MLPFSFIMNSFLPNPYFLDIVQLWILLHRWACNGLFVWLLKMSQEDYVTEWQYQPSCSPSQGQACDGPCFMCRALLMLHELEKLAVPHSAGAKEVVKHPAGWRSVAGAAESFPEAISSPKSFKMFVFKKRTGIFFSISFAILKYRTEKVLRHGTEKASCFCHNRREKKKKDR